ncbi:MAG: NAD-dependent epimerase/dehydratase family protein [Micropruina sp.]
MTGTRWDAVVDLTRQPGQVCRAVHDLSTRHWMFVSTANVYADQATTGQDESAALLPPLEADTMTDPAGYGPAKVACENLVRGTTSSTIVRAGLIVGPGDVSGRLGYWPWRFARDIAAPVLIPDDSDQPVQLIDVGDLAWEAGQRIEPRAAGLDDLENAELARALSVDIEARP